MRRSYQLLSLAIYFMAIWIYAGDQINADTQDPFAELSKDSVQSKILGYKNWQKVNQEPQKIFNPVHIDRASSFSLDDVAD